jgi:hypothetical protein
MSDNRIIKDKCDCCGKRELGVELYHLGTPVLFHCRGCQPKTFEQQARVDIDRWLSGGRLHG